MQLLLAGIFLAAAAPSAGADTLAAVDPFERIGKIFPDAATRDWERRSAGPYYVENNVWNKGATGPGYRQHVGIRPLAGAAVEAGWAWDWPTCSKIVAFPDILHGKNPWADSSTTPLLPMRLSSIASLHADLDLEQGGTGHRNTAFQIWLVDSAGDKPENITREVMVWIANDDLPFPPVVDRLRVGGREWALSKMENHGDPNIKPRLRWTYLSFSGKERISRGRIDLKEFFDTLVVRGMVSPRERLAVINLGNEIRDGKGFLHLRSYRIDLRGKP
ncbi:MAG TPA: hypothetical protein PK208_08045 [Fibrobacteria bacterium]|nr:hypothetical protein [Fibrobacteria bacterium]